VGCSCTITRRRHKVARQIQGDGILPVWMAASGMGGFEGDAGGALALVASPLTDVGVVGASRVVRRFRADVGCRG